MIVSSSLNYLTDNLSTESSFAISYIQDFE